jgi:hypothetical protein
VGDRDRTAHEANLFDIDSNLAHVKPLADVIAWIEAHK